MSLIDLDFQHVLWRPIRYCADGRLRYVYRAYIQRLLQQIFQYIRKCVEDTIKVSFFGYHTHHIPRLLCFSVTREFNLTNIEDGSIEINPDPSFRVS